MHEIRTKNTSKAQNFEDKVHDQILNDFKATGRDPNRITNMFPVQTFYLFVNRIA